jgi:hypothetical protein
VKSFQNLSLPLPLWIAYEIDKYVQNSSSAWAPRRALSVALVSKRFFKN